MFLYYEDEEYSMYEYINSIRENGWEIEVYGNADDFLKIFKEKFNKIELLIIDIMVFGPGNDFDGRDTNNGLEAGIVLLDFIEQIEKNSKSNKPKLKIILTNKIESQVENLKNDSRVNALLLKPEITPSELIEEIQNLLK